MYALGTFLSIGGAMFQNTHATLVRDGRHERIVLGMLVLGVALLGGAIAARWVRIGHGPWISLFELLMSQLWSLGVVFTIAYWRMPRFRPSAIVVLPVLWVLGTGYWVLGTGQLGMLEPKASHFPATYYNEWKWIHVFLGKIYLALLLIGAGLGGVLILRRFTRAAAWFKSMPREDDRREPGARLARVPLYVSHLARRHRAPRGGARRGVGQRDVAAGNSGVGESAMKRLLLVEA